MYDDKVIEEAKARIEAGDKAREFLAKVEREQRADRASDLDAFKKLSGAERTQIYLENPQRYRALYRQWTDELAQKLIEKGGS